MTEVKRQQNFLHSQNLTALTIHGDLYSSISLTKGYARRIKQQPAQKEIFHPNSILTLSSEISLKSLNVIQILLVLQKYPITAVRICPTKYDIIMMTFTKAKQISAINYNTFTKCFTEKITRFRNLSKRTHLSKIRGGMR